MTSLYNKIINKVVNPPANTGFKRKTKNKRTRRPDDQNVDSKKAIVYPKYPNVPMFDNDDSIMPAAVKVFFNLIFGDSLINIAAKAISAIIYIFTGTCIPPKKLCSTKGFNFVQNGALWLARKAFQIAFPELDLIEFLIEKMEIIMHIEENVKSFIIKVITAIIKKANVNKILGSIDCSQFAGQIGPHSTKEPNARKPRTSDGPSLTNPHIIEQPNPNSSNGAPILLPEESNPLLGVGDIVLPETSHQVVEELLAKLIQLYNELDIPSDFHTDEAPHHTQNLAMLSQFHSENEMLNV